MVNNADAISHTALTNNPHNYAQTQHRRRRSGDLSQMSSDLVDMLDASRLSRAPIMDSHQFNESIRLEDLQTPLSSKSGGWGVGRSSSMDSKSGLQHNKGNNSSDGFQGAAKKVVSFLGGLKGKGDGRRGPFSSRSGGLDNTGASDVLPGRQLSNHHRNYLKHQEDEVSKDPELVRRYSDPEEKSAVATKKHPEDVSEYPDKGSSLKWTASVSDEMPAATAEQHPPATALKRSSSAPDQMLEITMMNMHPKEVAAYPTMEVSKTTPTLQRTISSSGEMPSKVAKKYRGSGILGLGQRGSESSKVKLAGSMLEGRDNKEPKHDLDFPNNTPRANASWNAPLVARHGCTAYFDLSQSLSSSNPPTSSSCSNDDDKPARKDFRYQFATSFHQQKSTIWLKFVTEVHNQSRLALQEAYGAEPDRNDTSKYVVLDGTDMALCVFEPAPGHTSPEFTAVWFAAKLFTLVKRAGHSLRCGLCSGTVETVSDIYRLPKVSGSSIRLAANIMDCALPGQMLVSSKHVVPSLESETCYCYGRNGDYLKFEVEPEIHEVVDRNDRTVVVQCITGFVSIRISLPGTPSHSISFGRSHSPNSKWYLRLKPADLEYDPSRGISMKIPPAELLWCHRRVAFVGVTNGQLAKVFKSVLDAKPDQTWDKMFFLFLSDDQLGWIEKNSGADVDEGVEKLVADKYKARAELEGLLRGRAQEMRFLEYDKPFYCASYWDWDERGGFIHVSPLVWGANPRTCPAMNYHWISTDAEDDYASYQDGLIRLLQASKPI